MTQARPAIIDTLDAFCTDTEAFLEGTPGGPLSTMTFAAKDIFDVAGHVTGARQPRLEGHPRSGGTHRVGHSDPGRRRRRHGGQDSHRRTHPRYPGG